MLFAIILMSALSNEVPCAESLNQGGTVYLQRIENENNPYPAKNEVLDLLSSRTSVKMAGGGQLNRIEFYLEPNGDFDQTDIRRLVKLGCTFAR